MVLCTGKQSAGKASWQALNAVLQHCLTCAPLVLVCCLHCREPSIVKLIATLRSYNGDLDYALQYLQMDSSIMFIDTVVDLVKNMTAHQRAAQKFVTDAQLKVFDDMDTRNPDDFFKAMGDVAVNTIMPLCNNDADCPLYWVRPVHAHLAGLVAPVRVLHRAQTTPSSRHRFCCCLCCSCTGAWRQLQAARPAGARADRALHRVRSTALGAERLLVRCMQAALTCCPCC